MRVEFSKAMMKYAEKNEKLFFLTGDLGFMAFEELKKILGNRFLNMGVSEQNMISVSASLAHDGFIPFVYSIAPFLVARPFEQIRNEIGLHHKAVKLVANGGGFGYGIMGSTHHCLEDIALMRSVPNMKLFLPTFLEDVDEAVNLMIADKSPNYLRLNSSVKRSAEVKPFHDFRMIRQGTKGVVLGAGPVMNQIIESNDQQNLGLEIWLIDQLPIQTLPTALLERIKENKKIILVEEHYQAGGLGEMFTVYLFQNKLIEASDQISFHYLNVKGYVSGNYGDQKWHLAENNLYGESLHQALKQITQS
jgi:transketolase